MTLEDLADLIRANSANTNGRIDRVDSRIEGLQTETNAALMNLQNDMTDVRTDLKSVKSELADVKRSLDLTPILSTMQ